MTSLMLKLGLGAALSLASLTNANAAEGAGGHGGGGVRENGRYTTFYSAGIVVDPKPKRADQIPGLMENIKFINNTKFLSVTPKSELMGALIPTSDRNYYDVKRDQFTPSVRRALMHQYSRVTGADPNTLAIYAVTEIRSKTTYLLPEFYKLKKVTEQQAILFHEALWLKAQNPDYRSVISAEIAYQSHLENPDDFESARKYVRAIGDVADYEKLAYLWDRQSGVIDAKGNLQGKELTLEFLIGSSMSMNDQNRKDGLKARAIENALKYPQSKFLQFWKDASVAEEIRISDGCDAVPDATLIANQTPEGWINFKAETRRTEYHGQTTTLECANGARKCRDRDQRKLMIENIMTYRSTADVNVAWGSSITVSCSNSSDYGGNRVTEIPK